VKWDTARPSALAAPHRHRAAGKVEVAQLHVARLLHPQPRVGQQCQDGLVAQPQPLVSLGAYRPQQRVDRLDRDRARGWRVERQVLQLAHRALGDDALGDQPGPEAAQRGDRAVDRRRRLAVLDLPRALPALEVHLAQQRRVEGRFRVCSHHVANCVRSRRAARIVAGVRRSSSEAR
jgi:hypothetical protein